MKISYSRLGMKSGNPGGAPAATGEKNWMSNGNSSEKKSTVKCWICSIPINYLLFTIRLPGAAPCLWKRNVWDWKPTPAT